MRCETATSPRCKCRCAGAFHGAARVENPDDLAWLAGDDPHRPAVVVTQLTLEDLEKLRAEVFAEVAGGGGESTSGTRGSAAPSAAGLVAS